MISLEQSRDGPSQTQRRASSSDASPNARVGALDEAKAPHQAAKPPSRMDVYSRLQKGLKARHDSLPGRVLHSRDVLLLASRPPASAPASDNLTVLIIILVPVLVLLKGERVDPALRLSRRWRSVVGRRGRGRPHAGRAGRVGLGRGHRTRLSPDEMKG